MSAMESLVALPVMLAHENPGKLAHSMLAFVAPRNSYQPQQPQGLVPCGQRDPEDSVAARPEECCRTSSCRDSLRLWEWMLSAPQTLEKVLKELHIQLWPKGSSPLRRRTPASSPWL